MPIDYNSKTWKLLKGYQESTDAVRVLPCHSGICNGNGNAGLLLAQIIYWFLPDKNGKSKLRVQRYGHIWLAKTHKEWVEETGIKERSVRTSLDLLQELGIIETRNLGFKGRPTTHIWLNEEVLLEKMLFYNSTSLHSSPKPLPDCIVKSPDENVNSNTYTTTDITRTGDFCGSSSTTEKQEWTCSPPGDHVSSYIDGKKMLSEKYTSSSMPFDVYEKTYDVDPEAADVISCYMEEYETHMGKKHPNLKVEQWEMVVSEIFIEDGFMMYDPECMNDMIRKHFQTDYKGKTDYNIIHFISGKIREHRFYEECYNV